MRFSSSRPIASKPPIAIEAKPRMSSACATQSARCTSGSIRAIKKTPAATIAAECKYEETGVGATMARGSQK